MWSTRAIDGELARAVVAGPAPRAARGRTLPLDGGLAWSILTSPKCQPTSARAWCAPESSLVTSSRGRSRRAGAAAAARDRARAAGRDRGRARGVLRVGGIRAAAREGRIGARASRPATRPVRGDGALARRCRCGEAPRGSSVAMADPSDEHVTQRARARHGQQGRCRPSRACETALAIEHAYARAMTPRRAGVEDAPGASACAGARRRRRPRRAMPRPASKSAGTAAFGSARREARCEDRHARRDSGESRPRRADRDLVGRRATSPSGRGDPQPRGRRCAVDRRRRWRQPLSGNATRRRRGRGGGVTTPARGASAHAHPAADDPDRWADLENPSPVNRIARRAARARSVLPGRLPRRRSTRSARPSGPPMDLGVVLASLRATRSRDEAFGSRARASRSRARGAPARAQEGRARGSGGRGAGALAQGRRPQPVDPGDEPPRIPTRRESGETYPVPTGLVRATSLPRGHR